MSHDPRTDGQAAPMNHAAKPETHAEEIGGIRAVHRAVADLRRGTPVLLEGDGGRSPVLVLAAETAGARGLRDLAALAAGPPVLVMAAGMARARHPDLHRDGEIGAFAVADRLADPAALRALADPTADELIPEPPRGAPLPPCAAEALALVKLGRVLPAALVAPAAADSAQRIGGFGLLAVPAAAIRAYPLAMAADLARVTEARVPLQDARDSRIVAFRAPDAGIEHLAILVGAPETAPCPLVRLHSECFTGDLLGSLRCDCGAQLRGAIRRMGEEGAGVLLYLAQEGRGIGLANKLRAYVMQDRGLDTLDANRALGWGADERNFLTAATMLHELGLHRVRLLTNNPAKVEALAACGLDVTREAHAFPPNGVNDRYLATKAERFGHLPG